MNARVANETICCFKNYFINYVPNYSFLTKIARLFPLEYTVMIFCITLEIWFLRSGSSFLLLPPFLHSWDFFFTTSAYEVPIETMKLFRLLQISISPSNWPQLKWNFTHVYLCLKWLCFTFSCSYFCTNYTPAIRTRYSRCENVILDTCYKT